MNGDTVNETDETFKVVLSAPVNAILGPASEGVCTILNDDAFPKLSIADQSVPEGDTGVASAAFTVLLSAASGQPVSVDYATSNGTAQAGSDYGGPVVR